MQQLSENVIVLNVGDQIPPGTEDSLKIFLTGSIDVGPGGEFNWQAKFQDAFVKLVSPTEGMLAYSRFNYILISNYYVPKNPVPNIFNEEAVNKLDWELGMMEAADCIFVNFLKRSQAALPLFYYGYASRSQRVLVRCPEEYKDYWLVYNIAKRFNIPFVPGKIGSVAQIVGMMFSFCPKFQDITRTQLPE